MTTFAPTINPEIEKRIRQAVEHLEVPPEATLVQAFYDLQRQFEASRRALFQEEERVFADGHAALARILLSADDIKSQPDGDYFNRHFR